MSSGDDSSQSSSNSSKKKKKKKNEYEPWRSTLPEGKTLIQYIKNFPLEEPNINPFSSTAQSVKDEFPELYLDRFNPTSLRNFLNAQKNKRKNEIDKERQRKLQTGSKAQKKAASKAAYEELQKERNDGEVKMSGTVDATALANRVHRVMAAKQASGLTYDEIAHKIGLTNAYTAQLLLGQAKLTAETASELQAALPGISNDDLQAMQSTFPMRSFDEQILQEPNVYRTYEAITHYGEAIKSIINEQCGDGIMSAIDFYLDVGTTTGKHGEKRVVITFNGKFLPHIEQKAEDNGAKSPRS